MATFPIALRNLEMKIHSARQLARIAKEVGGSLADEKSDRTYGSTAGDERTLRGIPAIGRGVSGAIPGSRPDALRNLD